MEFFEAIFKMFGRAILEVTQVKGGRMVKEQDLEAEKILILFMSPFSVTSSFSTLIFVSPFPQTSLFFKVLSIFDTLHILIHQ